MKNVHATNSHKTVMKEGENYLFIFGLIWPIFDCSGFFFFLMAY